MRLASILAASARLAPILGLTVLAGGCVAADPELNISQVEVTNTTDGFGGLEVEVHVYDNDTQEWLGCAGQDQGLENVDASDVLYDVNATPVDGGGNYLHQSDLRGRTIFFEVVEDDTNPCPTPPEAGDDIIGTSGPLDGASLGSSYAFEDVVQLDVGY